MQRFLSVSWRNSSTMMKRKGRGQIRVSQPGHYCHLGSDNPCILGYVAAPLGSTYWIPGAHPPLPTGDNQKGRQALPMLQNWPAEYAGLRRSGGRGSFHG